MLPALHIVIITSNEPAHEAPCLQIIPLRLCYKIHNSSHFVGYFESPQGGNPSMLLPAGRAIRGDGEEAAGESLGLQTHGVFERCHVHAPQGTIRVRQALFSAFVSFTGGSELLQLGALPCGVLGIQVLNMKLLQGHIFFFSSSSSSFFFFFCFVLVFF